MGRKVNLDTGIEIWDGQPGSGKSYGAVDFLVKVILLQRRPVFTNLPLRYRVIRKYLTVKGKDAILARYIRVVSREHFYRFVQRNQLLTEYAEIMKAEGWSHAKIEASFCEQEGEHVYRGTEANWFYPGSVFIFDEFHRWADQRVQKNEDPAFLNYATMHRHHLHWIILLTQDKMQVSIPWRRNCSKFIHCADKRRLPFMFGLKLPIPAFAYEEYPAEMLDRGDFATAKPINVEVKIPWMNGSTLWRLYDSFTHMGGYRRLSNKLDAVRSAIEDQPRTATETDDVPKKRSKLALLWPLLALGLGVALAVQLLGGCEPASEDLPEAPPTASPPPTVQEVAPYRPTPALPPPERFEPTVSIASRDFVVADGRTVHRGGQHQGWTLVGIEVSDGSTLWEKDGEHRPVDFGRVSGDGAGDDGADALRRIRRNVRNNLEPGRPRTPDDAGDSGP
ncbi:MAG: zonular occludens toxin domain-containing protein [Planctomycetota bacterium]